MLRVMCILISLELITMQCYLIFRPTICIHINPSRDSCLKKEEKKEHQVSLKFPSISMRERASSRHRFFYLALHFSLGSFACTDISISPRTSVSIFRSMERRTFARGSTSRHAVHVRAWNAAPGSGFCNVETGVLDVASRRSNLSCVYAYTGCLVTSTRVCFSRRSV